MRHYIFTILQSSTRRISSLESWRMTDRQRRKNHYGTSHQVRKTFETTGDSPWRRNLRVPGHYDKNWWYAPSRWFLRRKKIPRSENTLGTHLSADSAFDHENEMRNNVRVEETIFFSFKAFCGIRSNRFCSLCIERKREEIGLRKKHSV